jgi:hypothetical protein
MPTRRIFRRKQRSEPMTPFAWKFFMAQSVADFDVLAASTDSDDASQFFFLYYDDAWVRLYRDHRDEIEAEWRRRSWTREQKRFVMTPYRERHVTLRHDAERAERMELWKKWTTSEGWKTGETWQQYLAREGAKSK